MMGENFCSCYSLSSDSTSEYESDIETGLLEEGNTCTCNCRSLGLKSSPQNEQDSSFENIDVGPTEKIPKFNPYRKPGAYIFDKSLRAARAESRRYTTPGSFFKLFFCEDVMLQIVTFTNKYASIMKRIKPYVYYNWTDVSTEDLYIYLALLMYMCIVPAPTIADYWSTDTLFHGLWGRAFMSQKRFELISESLRVSDCELDCKNDQLSKVRIFQVLMQGKAVKFWQPLENLCIGIHTIKCNRKHGIKLMVLTDSSNGYTCNFTTKDNSGLRSTENKLSTDVTLSLLQCFMGQGYRLFTDEYFTSKELFLELLKHKTVACGSIPSSQIDVLASLRYPLNCNKRFGHGFMSWMRTDNLGLIHWKDCRMVTLLTSMHRNLTDMEFVIRKIRVNGEHRKIKMRKPIVVKDYEKAIYSMDTSERLIDRCPVVRECCETWKVLFYTIVDIARGNSLVLFKEFAKQNPDITELHRPSAYSQLQFTIELIKELGNITDHTMVPLTKKVVYSHVPVPEFGDKKRNCVRCYRTEKVEHKTVFRCKECANYLCFTRSRNCLFLEHTQ